jgi:hypothetical protein
MGETSMNNKTIVRGCMITVALALVGMCILSTYGFVALTSRVLGVA